MVVSNHEGLDWWAKMSPVFEDYLADSYLCDVWFVCSDRIVPAHKLVLAQLGDWNKRTGTLLDWLESEETFITVDDWTGDQVTQMLIEIYNIDTKSLGSETKILMKGLGIKFEENKLTGDLSSDSEDEADKLKSKGELDIFISDDEVHPPEDEDSKSQNFDVSFDSEISCSKDETEGFEVEDDTDSSVVVTGSMDKSQNIGISCSKDKSDKDELEDEKDSVIVTGTMEKSQNMNISVNSDKSCSKGEIKIKKEICHDEVSGNLEAALNQCVACSSNLMNHSKINEKSKLEYMCCIEGCNKHFTFTADFVDHMNEHVVELESATDPQKFSEDDSDVQRLCCLCNEKRIKHRNDQARDEKVSYKGSFYKCCKCSASKLRAKSFYHHVENHLAKKFKCNKCDKGFSYQYLLDDHVRDFHTTSVKLTFNCLYEGCDYKAKFKQTLNTHVREKHMGIKKVATVIKDTSPMKCPTCQKTVKVWYYEKYHKKTCGENSVVYQCDICTKSGFVNSVTLQNHVRAMHSNEKPFTCEHCDKSFSRSESLSKHRALNHGVNYKGEAITRKLYSCDYCGKLLTSKTKLVNHVKVIHEGIKDFKCKFCDKSFGSKNNLDLHEGAVHTGKLPYQCYFCNKSFSRKNLLNDHQLTHTKKGKENDQDTSQPTTSKTVQFDKVQYVTHLDDVDNLEIVDNIERDESQDHLVVSEQIMEVDEHGVIQEIVDL